MDIFLSISCSNILSLAVRNDFRLFTKISFSATRNTCVCRTRGNSFKNLYRWRNIIALFHSVGACWYSLISYGKTKTTLRFYKAECCSTWSFRHWEWISQPQFWYPSGKNEEPKTGHLPVKAKAIYPTANCVSLHIDCVLYLLINWKVPCLLICDNAITENQTGIKSNKVYTSLYELDYMLTQIYSWI